MAGRGCDAQCPCRQVRDYRLPKGRLSPFANDQPLRPPCGRPYGWLPYLMPTAFRVSPSTVLQTASGPVFTGLRRCLSVLRCLVTAVARSRDYCHAFSRLLSRILATTVTRQLNAEKEQEEAHSYSSKGRKYREKAQLLRKK